MSTDALIVKFYETLTETKEKHCYVFYDHDLNTFAIRGGTRNGKAHRKTYSFYCNRASDVYTFLQIMFSDAQNLYFSLMNNSEFPAHSDDISYEFLLDCESNKTSRNISSNCLVRSLETLMFLPTPIFNYDLYTNASNRHDTSIHTVGDFVISLLDTVRYVHNDY
jgi:hypothetical protein